MRRGLPAALLLLAACVGGEEPAEEPRRCQLPLEVPSGFEPLPSFEEEYPDHVGVRLGFRDDERRELHVAAGIPGEWTEGLPTAGSISLAGGRSGVLAGDPSHDVWVVMWERGDVCDPRVVLSNGFTREGFLSVLEQVGIAPPV